MNDDMGWIFGIIVLVLLTVGVPNTGEPITQKILFQSYKTSLSPYLATVDYFTINIPNWVTDPFWAQQIYGMGGNDNAAYIANNINTLWAPYTAAAIGPPAPSSLFINQINPNYFPFINPSIPSENTPTCTAQLYLDVLPTTYYGNNTLGQILLITTIDGTMNKISQDILFKFPDQTRRNVVSALRPYWNFSLVDKNNQPFITLTATFDLTITIQCENALL
jgi:hypothetical protein